MAAAGARGRNRSQVGARETYRGRLGDHGREGHRRRHRDTARAAREAGGTTLPVVLRAWHRHPGMAGHPGVMPGRRLALRSLLRCQDARAHPQRPPDERDADGDGDEQPEAACEPTLSVHYRTK